MVLVGDWWRGKIAGEQSSPDRAFDREAAMDSFLQAVGRTQRGEERQLLKACRLAKSTSISCENSNFCCNSDFFWGRVGRGWRLAAERVVDV